jgi:hypothetical protein
MTMTPEQIELAIETGELVERYVSYYGDGAVLDCAKSPLNCRKDDEEDEDGNPQHTAIVRVVLPRADYLKVHHYCRGNNGPDPLSDAYEAAQIIATSVVESDVWSCDVPWSTAECDRLGGCFLCGGRHDS